MMAEKRQDIRPSFIEPAIYRIRVSGELDFLFSDRLEGMNITTNRLTDGNVESILIGRMSDQAALSGVLNTIYELHFPIIAVDCLGGG